MLPIDVVWRAGGFTYENPVVYLVTNIYLRYGFEVKSELDNEKKN